MKFIGFGAIVVDYYYQNGKFLGRMNGKSFSNICVHLKHFGNPVFIYGTVGNDETGKFALHIFDDLQIERKIEVLNKRTNRFYIMDHRVTKEFENEKFGYTDRYNYSIIANERDIVVVDNVNKNTLRNLNHLPCTVVLDLGAAISFVYMSKEEILFRLAKRFTIINMNEKVFQILKKKLGADERKLFDLLGVQFLVITYGAKGISFVSEKGVREFWIDEPFQEVDCFGAGDAFFAVILDCYVKNNRQIDDSFLENCFTCGNKYVKQVLCHYGALGSILPLRK